MVMMGIGGLGPWELAIVLVIVLVVFGAGKLPSIGTSLGEAIRNFKKGMNSPDVDKDNTGDDKTNDPPKP